MRVLVLTTDQPNQAALVRRLGEACEVVGVVLSANVSRRRQRHGARRWADRIAGQTVGRPFTSAWSRMLTRYARQGAFPDLPTLEVANVNDAPVLGLIDELAPDLVAVSGTNLVGEAVIEAAPRGRGIVNLHTGVSPQIKGGPNCTNWCLARGWFHLIGNSVLWLDLGVDSGNLIATERTPLAGEDLEQVHWKVMEHSHDLYVRAIGAIAAIAWCPMCRRTGSVAALLLQRRLDGGGDAASPVELRAALREGGSRQRRNGRVPGAAGGCSQARVTAAWMED